MTATLIGRAGTREPAAPPPAVEALAWGGARLHPALRWAAVAARRQQLPLRVLVTADAPAGPPAHRAAFAHALTMLHVAQPDLTLSVRVEPGPTTQALCTRSVDAAVLAVPAGLPELDAIVARAHCPVVVVPDRPMPPGGPVVVGVAPWTTEHTVDLAFAEAAARHTRLLAVRAWTHPTVDLGRPLPDRIAAWDRLERRAKGHLELALAADRGAHPDVPVELVVAQDDPTALLLTLASCAQLVVLGRWARPDGPAGSPVETLIRAATAPVMVVPPEPGDGHR